MFAQAVALAQPRPNRRSAYAPKLPTRPDGKSAPERAPEHRRHM